MMEGRGVLVLLNVLKSISFYFWSVISPISQEVQWKTHVFLKNESMKGKTAQVSLKMVRLVAEALQWWTRQGEYSKTIQVKKL